MKISMSMDVCETLESLVYNIAYLDLREGLLAIFSELVDILIHVFEDKVQGVLVFDNF